MYIVAAGAANFKIVVEKLRTWNVVVASGREIQPLPRNTFIEHCAVNEPLGVGYRLSAKQWDQ